MNTPSKTGKDVNGGKTGEAAGRERGYEDNGGKPGNDLLEDGQLRGVDEDGQVKQGTHEGVKKKG